MATRLALLCALGAAIGGCGPDASRVPMDLIPCARLSASATRPVAGLDWPREAVAAPACVRDGHPDTGWAVPLDGPASLEIDLLPWLGAPAPLERLEADWSGPPPERVALRLGRFCGDPDARQLAWTDPAVALDLGGARAGCATLEVEASAELSLTALALEGRVDPARLPAPAPDRGPAAHPDSGVIEGFYGQPWSPTERRHMLAHMAALGLGSFLYAPKDDPLHRARWREPYPPEALAGFTALAAEADRLGLRFLFGVSPFIDYDPDAEADYQALLDKLSPLVRAGLSGVALLADDIEFELQGEIDGALGGLHVAVATRLFGDLRALDPELVFWFVPTVYTDGRLDQWPGGADYLAALNALPPQVRIMWVGPGVFNASLAPADLQAFTDSVTRPPLLWDNFWANDGGDGLLGRLLLAPYSGHAPELPAAVSGVAQNLSIQGALSRLSLTTFARWLEGAEAADFEAARLDAAAQEEPFLLPAHPGRAADDPSPLPLVMACFEANGMQTPGHRDMEAAVARLRQAITDAGDTLDPAAVADDLAYLLDLFCQLACLPGRLHHSRLDPDLVDDLAFPLARLEQEGRMGLATLEGLALRLAGADPAGALARAEDARAAALRSRFVFSPQVISDLLLQVSAAGPFPAAGLRWLPADPDLPACRARKAWTHPPFPEAAEIRVHGLPGATVEGGRVDWIPPHAGRYTFAVWGRDGATAFGAWTGSLICSDP